MKIIVGKNSGFCFGVRRAISGTEEQVEKYKKIKCLGHLVHNEIVTKELLLLMISQRLRVTLYL